VTFSEYANFGSQAKGLIRKNCIWGKGMRKIKNLVACVEDISIAYFKNATVLG
jgi:hypothetical protein